jgi:hypothetical protein
LLSSGSAGSRGGSIFFVSTSRHYPKRVVREGAVAGVAHCAVNRHTVMVVHI